MNARLSPLMLDVLKTIDAGEPKPKVPRIQLIAIWRRGLIEDVPEHKSSTMHGHAGWRLTAEGKLALRHGRQMLSRRTP